MFPEMFAHFSTRERENQWEWWVDQGQRTHKGTLRRTSKKRSWGDRESSISLRRSSTHSGYVTLWQSDSSGSDRAAAEGFKTLTLSTLVLTQTIFLGLIHLCAVLLHSSFMCFGVTLWISSFFSGILWNTWSAVVRHSHPKGTHTHTRLAADVTLPHDGILNLGPQTSAPLKHQPVPSVYSQPNVDHFMGCTLSKQNPLKFELMLHRKNQFLPTKKLFPVVIFRSCLPKSRSELPATTTTLTTLTPLTSTCWRTPCASSNRGRVWKFPCTTSLLTAGRRSGWGQMHACVGGLCEFWNTISSLIN